jgi:hypothetical protein
MAERKPLTPEEREALLGQVAAGPIETAPTEHIDRHPEVLADFMRRVCGLAPGEYALSDESVLSDLETDDSERLFAYVRDMYGVDVPGGPDQPFLWQVIDKIAARQ